jgi:hypothetical protein
VLGRTVIEAQNISLLVILPESVRIFTGRGKKVFFCLWMTKELTKEGKEKYFKKCRKRLEKEREKQRRLEEEAKRNEQEPTDLKQCLKNIFNILNNIK